MLHGKQDAGSTPVVGTSGDKAKIHDDEFFSEMTSAGLQPPWVSAGCNGVADTGCPGQQKGFESLR